MRRRTETSDSRARVRMLVAKVSNLATDIFTAVLLLMLILQIVNVTVASGQTNRDDTWCEDDSDYGRKKFCEVREYTLKASREMSVDAGMNGGIEVTAWDGDGIEVKAKVSSWASSEADARNIAGDVEVFATPGKIHAEGPEQTSKRRGRSTGWSVSYRIRVPRNMDLDLEAFNGGISVNGVRGVIRFKTLNGGLHLEDLAGDVQGETTNGGVSVQLTGKSWDGSGLEVRTTNGGVSVAIPEDYSADFETGTVNGGLDIDLPVRVRGRRTRVIQTTLGDGGAPIQVMTTNGGVRVRRS